MIEALEGRRLLYGPPIGDLPIISVNMRLVEGPGNGGQGVDVVVNEESGRTQAAAGDDAGAPGTDRNVLTFEVFLGNNLLAHDLTVNLEYKGLEPGQRAASRP